MKKTLIISGLIIGTIAAFNYVTNKVIPKTEQFLKDNFSIALSGFKVHKINWSGVELRLTADLINLTSITTSCEKLKADIFYMNKGVPSPLATTTINEKFIVKPKDTTRIRDIKVFANTLNITRNLSILSSPKREFMVVLSCLVNGQKITITKNTIA